MWVHPALAGHLRPTIVSHGFQSYQGSASGKLSTSTSGAELPYARDYSQLQWWHGQPSSSGVVTRRDQAPVSKLLSALVWDGCRDYTSLLCVPSALALWHAIPASAATSTVPTSPTSPTSPVIASNTSSTGMEACRTYIKQLLHGQVVQFLMEEWRLQEEDFAAPRQMRENVPMVLVSANKPPYLLRACD